MKKIAFIPWLALSALLILPPQALAKPFTVTEDKHNPNFATFHSRAALVRFQGTTSKVFGSADVDPDHPEHASGEIRIDLASLDTGIEKRNGHMRSVLEVEKHPFAVFKLKRIQGAHKLEPNRPVTLTVAGDMLIHGVTRSLVTEVTVVYLPESALSEQDRQHGFRKGDWISLSTSFKLKLRDFNVEPPGLVPLKVAEEVTIELDVNARAQ